MSDSEYRSFMTAGTRTAKWAISRTDGRPHVVPVWFVLEGETCCHDRQHVGQGPRRASRSAGGVVRRRRTPAMRVRLDRGPCQHQHGRLNTGEGMLLVRVKPEKVVSENNITGE